MAIGDQQDIYGRLRGYLPHWFGDAAQSPVLNGLLQGLAYAGAYVYSLYAYAKLQARILTATDGWLDMIAADFFGATIQRKANQTDASFRGTIILNLFRERATRNGMIKVLQDLTGRTPKIIEPTRPADTGAYGGTDSIAVIGAPQIYRNDWQGNQLLYATARTNLLLRSSSIGGAGWTNTSCTPTLNAGAGPDGANSATLLAANSSTFASSRSTAAVAASTVYTASVWFRKNTSSQIAVRIYDGTVATQIANLIINLSAGGVPSLSSSLNVIGTPQFVADQQGGYRVSFSFNSGSFTSIVALHYPDFSAGTGSTYFTYPQVEIGNQATSFVPTTTAAVTVTDYTLSSNGALTLAAAPVAGAVMSWTGSYVSTVQGTTINVNALQFSIGDGLTTSFSLAPKYGYNIGYGAAGAYGSLLMPYQCFVIAYRPLGTGIPNVAGYGISTGGYGQASQADYASMASIQGVVTDADIYAAIEATRPAATTVWTAIQS